MLGQASAIKARNQVSEYPPLSKLEGCFLCTTVLAAKIRQKSHFRLFFLLFHIFGIFLVHIPLPSFDPWPHASYRRATTRERYELLLQRCPGIVEHLALQDLASFLRPFGSKRQSRAPLRHSPTVVTHPQGRHVFGEIIPNIHKTSEHLFRLSPRQTLFKSRYERFRGKFSNFVARNDSLRGLQHDMNAPNGIFPRKRSI